MHYAGAQVSDDVKRFMALVAPGLKRHGVSFDMFRTLASEVGYEVSERTLREHRAAAAAGRLPLSTDKHAGRPRSLEGQHPCHVEAESATGQQGGGP